MSELTARSQRGGVDGVQRRADLVPFWLVQPYQHAYESAGSRWLLWMESQLDNLQSGRLLADFGGQKCDVEDGTRVAMDHGW
jgi:hypothetical protein